MYCKHCGNYLEDHARFCTQCGNAVEGRGGKKKTSASGGIKKAMRNAVSAVSGVWRKHGRLSILAVVGILLLILLIPIAGKRGRVYKQALEYLDSGDYEQAAELFQKLEDYKDSDVQYKEARYLLAEELLDAGDYDESAEIFSSLGEYQDAEKRYNRVRYQQAKKLGEKGKESEALAICEELLSRDYQKSDVQFLKGSLLLAQGEKYQDALSLFEKLAVDGYDGAEEMIDKTCYEWAKDLIRKDQKLEALEKFDLILDYADAEDCQEDLAEELFAEAKEYYRAGRYEKAQEYFNALYGYADTTYYSRLTSIYLDIEKEGYDNSNYMFADPAWSFYLDDFRDNFYVENTAEAMLSCTNLACAYLLGEWRTSNGSNYIKMERGKEGSEYNFYCSYNLPWYDGDYFTIQDGIYYNVKDGEEIMMYRMRLTGPNTLEVYAAKNGKTYILTKRK